MVFSCIFSIAFSLMGSSVCVYVYVCGCGCKCVCGGVIFKECKVARISFLVHYPIMIAKSDKKMHSNSSCHHCWVLETSTHFCCCHSDIDTGWTHLPLTALRWHMRKWEKEFFPDQSISVTVIDVKVTITHGNQYGSIRLRRQGGTPHEMLATQSPPPNIDRQC